MSPVFERMFNSDFKEKDANEIKLPGKSFELMQMLLLVAHPRIQKDLTVDNSMQLLPLAEEYQMDRIKEKCEACVRENLRNGARSRPDFFLRCLNLSERHNLMDIWELALDRCSSVPLNDCINSPEFKNTSPTSSRFLTLFGDRKTQTQTRQLNCNHCGRSIQYTEKAHGRYM
ncbi:hypothetical protein ScPMuIL_013783 [Solemya velum]